MRLGRTRTRFALSIAAVFMLTACGGAKSGTQGDSSASADTSTPAPVATTAFADRAAGDAVQTSDTNSVVVYKSPTCGCCKAWVERMETAGFNVIEHDTDELPPVKTKYGVPANLEACHTALVGGYVVEGHVPPETIRRLLRERPRVTGIAVPGMPAGSPGMEGGMKEAYNVVTFDKGGAVRVYEAH
jgi:hypothetical protein